MSNRPYEILAMHCNYKTASGKVVVTVLINAHDRGFLKAVEFVIEGYDLTDEKLQAGISTGMTVYKEIAKAMFPEFIKAPINS